MPVNAQRHAVTLPKLGPLIPGSRFRLGSKSYALTACVCLYRYEAAAATVAEYLVLTPDMRFAHVARPNSDTRAYAAIELDCDEAREFLMRHGEDDLVDDFPDLFTMVGAAERMIEGHVRSRQADRGTAH
jgi:hypothetical protein